MINRTWRLAPWADLLYAADARWWEHELAETQKDRSLPRLEAFAGLRVSTDERVKNMVPNVRRAPGEDKPNLGISTDPHFIRWGRNSGFQLLNVLAHMVGKGGRLLLCGYDFKPGPGGRLHHHPDHTGPLKNPDANSMAGWARLFDVTVPQFKQLGIEVINCSEETALTSFRRAHLVDVL